MALALEYNITLKTFIFLIKFINNQGYRRQMIKLIASPHVKISPNTELG